MSAQKTLPTGNGLSKEQQLDAICWAARKQGVSYGKFSVTLSDMEKYQIYEEYAALLEQKQAQTQN